MSGGLELSVGSLISEEAGLQYKGEGTSIRELYRELSKIYAAYCRDLKDFDRGADVFKQRVEYVARELEDFTQGSGLENRSVAVQTSPVGLREDADNMLTDRRGEVIRPYGSRLKRIPIELRAAIEQSLAVNPVPLDVYVHNHTDGQNSCIVIRNRLTPEQEVCLAYALTGKVPTGLNFLRERGHPNTEFRTVPYTGTIAALFGGEPLGENSYFHIEPVKPSPLEWNEGAPEREYMEMYSRGIAMLNSDALVVPFLGHIPFHAEGMSAFSIFFNHGYQGFYGNPDIKDKVEARCPKDHYRIARISEGIIEDTASKARKTKKWFDSSWGSAIHPVGQTLDYHQTSILIGDLVQKARERVIHLNLELGH